jgi:hypothetical protein
MRIVACITATGIITYYDMLGRYHEGSLAYLLALLLSSILHLVAAYRRYRRFEIDRAVKIANFRDPDLNKMTGFHMHYWSLQERSHRQEAAVDRITRNQVLADHYFYYPILPLIEPPLPSITLQVKARQLFQWMFSFILRTRKDFGTIEMSQGLLEHHSSMPSLFSRCYCCLDNDKLPTPSKMTLVSNEPQHTNDRHDQGRNAFLDLPPYNHSKINGKFIEPLVRNLQREKIKYHYLCHLCTDISQKSHLIDIHAALTFVAYGGSL